MDRSNSGELTLWQTVVFLAVKDALEGKGQDRPDLDRSRADQWIRDGGKDFRLVCTLAGIEAEFLRKSYLQGKISLELLIASETGNKAQRAREQVAAGEIGGNRRSSNAAR